MSLKYFIAFILLWTVTSANDDLKESQNWSVNAGAGRGVSQNRGSILETYFFDAVAECSDVSLVDYTDEGPKPETDSNANTAVDAHNEARRTVEPSAADMTEMSWDEELAALALAYSQECVFEHNPSRWHSEFGSRVGENLYISYGKSFSNFYIASALGSWNSERNYYDYDTMTCLPGKPCGHYTQMVWSSTYKVGCGATKCSSIIVQEDEWKDATLLVCNYGPAGNYRGEQPYLAGVPCDGCDPNQVCSNNLCSN